MSTARGDSENNSSLGFSRVMKNAPDCLYMTYERKKESKPSLPLPQAKLKQLFSTINAISG